MALSFASNGGIQFSPSLGLLLTTNQGAAFSLIIPAGCYLLAFGLNSRNANPITGGLKCGTSAGATDIISAQAVGQAGIINVFDSSILKRYYSAVAPQTLFFDAVTAWNGAFIDVGLLYANVAGA